MSALPPTAPADAPAPRRRTLIAGLGLAPWMLLPAATPLRAAPTDGLVMASFSLLADLCRELAPPALEVQSLVGPDADAHVFEPRPADVQRLARADLFVVNGLGFEGWLDRLAKVSGTRATRVVASEGLAPRRASDDGHGHAHGKTAADPHAWQHPAHLRRYAMTIAAAMARRWPAHAAEVNRRRDAWLARLAQVERDGRAWLDAVPRAQRRVVTSHDAFGYLGEAYGVDFLAAHGWATHSEPSAATVARLIRQIRQEGVRAVFVENISDARLIERIAREGGATLGGTLYSDALSRPGGPADTLLRLHAHNLRTLALALGSPAVPR
jgi:zinc/manganese transport system substrate-binding protein